jgi:DNA replication and repair protein RecF
MALNYLDIAGFRNLITVQLQPLSQGFNFIFGDNASGKTSLLEAIYYLSLGRSFRSSVTDRIIHNAAQKLSLFAQILSSFDQDIPIGLERHESGGINIRVDGKDVRSIAELATLLPVQLIDSHCHSLLDSGPAFRRRYLDWGVFYINPDFLRRWRQFEGALKQRNAALRGQTPRKELEIWTHELVEHALQLEPLRRAYAHDLIPLIEQAVIELLPFLAFKIDYYAGWNIERNYHEILTASLEKDLALGYTQSGPHKADLKILINEIPAKDILSRGQQKLFVCAMILARGMLLQNQVKKRSIYLVDDLPSELDRSSRTNLIALLSKQAAQIFVTAVERESVNDSLEVAPGKLFHVEHGRIAEASTG